MSIKTRQPTGKPSWPILLLAGAEKTGKSYASAVASSSPFIGRTFWYSFGEDDPDEYGAIPGVRFEIVEHDGTFRSLLAVLEAGTAEPVKDGKPNLLVIDSITRVWDLLTAEQQIIANDRARRKAQRSGRPLPDEDASIGQDQWNTAKTRWGQILTVLRQHQGPSIVTALLEEVSIVDAAGQPTKEKQWKVKAEKNLPSAVGVTVQMPERGKAFLTGVRSLRFKSEEPRTPYPAFTVEKLWTDLGITEKDSTTPRQHVTNDPEDVPAGEADVARHLLAAMCDERGWDRRAVAALWADSADVPLNESANAAAIRAFMAELDANGLPGQEKAA